MKRTAGAFVMLAALGGCASVDHGPMVGSGCGSCGGLASGPPTVPGVQGAWGQPVAMAAPYSFAPPGAEVARAMLAQSVPLDLVQASGQMPAGAPSGVVNAGGTLPPTGSGVISPAGLPTQPIVPGMCPPAGVVAAVGAGGMNGAACAYPSKRTEIRFAGPAGMKISWYSPTMDGRGSFSTNFLVAPAEYNFVQGAIYRLKLSDIPGRQNLELYPTIEIVPSNARTDAFVAHSSVPVSFTEEDFDQIAAGNYVVKVIYLPDPQFQDFATTGPDEVVSTRLDPGVNPIDEAQRRGNILLIIRVGNIKLEAANTPAMNAPPGMMPGMGMQMPTRMPAMPTSGRPGMVPMLPPVAPPAPTAGPVSSRSVDGSAIQQTQYKESAARAATAAQLAGASGQQATPVTTSSESKSAKSQWWWSSLGSDKRE